jgi:ABC-type nitrate/sulfonate/bicarbonate transport system permease component
MTPQVNDVLAPPFKDYARLIAFAGPTITSLVILGLWHGIVAAGIVSKLVLPEPSAVVGTLFRAGATSSGTASTLLPKPSQGL